VATHALGSLAPEPCIYHDGDMFIFMHIPKTAGTSFRTILEYIFGRRLCLDYNDRLFRPRQPEKIPGYCRCICGHFNRNKYATVFPNATYITWMRDPVERLVSSCYHHLRHQNPRDPFSVKIHREKIPFEQLVRYPEMQNQQRGMFGSFDTSDFAFIGIVEEFEKSMKCFRVKFGLHPLPTPQRINTNPKRKGARYDIPASLRKQLVRLNEADYALYEKARAELDAFHATYCR